MIRTVRDTLLSPATASAAGLVVLLAASASWFAPAASAAALVPSGAFVTNAASRLDPGSNDDASTVTRFNDFQRALRLSVQGQEALDRGAAGDAEALYEQALPLFERALGPEDLRIVGPLAAAADVYRARGEFDRAEVLYRRVAFLMEQAFGTSDIRVGIALASTAETVANQGRYGQAKGIYERALSIHQATLGVDDPRTLRVLNEYSGVLEELNRRDETEGLKTRVGSPANDELLGRSGG
jgi:tetratricopeptide (TPR) repeat protein